ncbi:alpha/beta fold hydrolase [Pseudonocardia pini]|uniref:alpha/beta fold hydrolase n=1 Tax=Pseudonocardia pini TaxID=2758030 RepID=UPI0015F0A91E|nr:alpha/beta hydrolase [Pseudonocardia pini]
MTSVVLLHGAWHRGSCWAPLQEVLDAPSVAPDLPAGPVGAAGYADSVEVPEGDLVIVGHSLGGLTAPVLAARVADRVRALVLLAAMVPQPGSSHLDLMRADPTISGRGPVGPQRGPEETTVWTPEAARAALYGGIAEELGDSAPVEAAIADLRPQSTVVTKEVTPLEEWPAVRTISVVCADDRMATPETSRRIARERGFELRELPGGHFPMLTRPRELAALLMATV